jgi:hypothetical protein
MILPGTYANGFAPRDGEPLFPELWHGCVGAWNPGLGPSGLTLRDWSPYKNHGTLTNMPANDGWKTSEGRHVLDFDGSNDFVDLGSWQPISTTQPFTLSAWVRISGFSGANYPNIIRLKTNAGNFGLSISNDSDVTPGRYLGILIGSANAAWGRFKNDLPSATWPGLWRHVAATYIGSSPTSATSFSTYMDGQSYALSPAFIFGTSPTGSAIGSDGSAATTMRGMLSDIAVHNRVLSHNEIRLLASRRGIAYEMAPRSWSAQQIAAYRARYYSQVIGGGVI